MRTAKHGNNQTKIQHSKGAEKRPPRSHWSKCSKNDIQSTPKRKLRLIFALYIIYLFTNGALGIFAYNFADEGFKFVLLVQ